MILRKLLVLCLAVLALIISQNIANAQLYSAPGSYIGPNGGGLVSTHTAIYGPYGTTQFSSGYVQQSGYRVQTGGYYPRPVPRNRFVIGFGMPVVHIHMVQPAYNGYGGYYVPQRTVRIVEPYYEQPHYAQPVRTVRYAPQEDCNRDGAKFMMFGPIPYFRAQWSF